MKTAGSQKGIKKLQVVFKKNIFVQNLMILNQI
jgi:hypothetical protein